MTARLGSSHAATGPSPRCSRLERPAPGWAPLPAGGVTGTPRWGVAARGDDAPELREGTEGGAADGAAELRGGAEGGAADGAAGLRRGAGAGGEG